MKTTDKEIKLLARFVLEVLADWPDMGSLDGGDLQEIAVKHNILIPHIVHGPCCDDCYCAQFYGDGEMLEGVTCYRVADWLSRAAEQRDEADGELAGKAPNDLSRAPLTTTDDRIYSTELTGATPLKTLTAEELNHWLKENDELRRTSRQREE